jgi:hypothetical protein
LTGTDVACDGVTHNVKAKVFENVLLTFELAEAKLKLAVQPSFPGREPSDEGVVDVQTGYDVYVAGLVCAVEDA